ncbi:MAG TPA: FG-GAP-like repeat-containing protein [Chitinophagaceae bacterium]|nr:FG-GAP-like repeat-containing protein [Chitinophagaceae bacterium]
MFASTNLRFSFGNCVRLWVLFSAAAAILITGCGKKPGAAAGDDDNKDPGALAVLNLQQNHFDEAEASFLKAIKVSPNEILNYVDLSLLYLLQKNYDAAEKQAKAGLQVKPGNVDLELILAEAYEKKQDRNSAVQQLNEIIQKDPRNAKAYYKLAGLPPAAGDLEWQKQYLLKVTELAPTNIVPRLQLVIDLATQGKADSARYYLESVKKILPAFTATAKAPYDKAVSLLQANKPADALNFIQQFNGLMQIAPEYAAGSDELGIPKLVAGYPAFTSSRYTHLSKVASTQKNSILDDIRFTDASASAGLTAGNTGGATHSVMAIADYDIQGNFYVYTSFTADGAASSQGHFFSSKMGGFTENRDLDGLKHDGQDLDATFADYDNDGYQDLLITTTKGMIVYHNEGDGTFTKVSGNIGLNNAAGGRKMLFADFDQDGDLDLYIACKGGNKFFRNNGDGTFTEEKNIPGLTGNPNETVDMDFGDWDSDGDLDIASVDENGKLALLNNNRHSNFSDISDSLGLVKPGYTGTAVAFGDYNNDGMLDMFVAGGLGGACYLLTNVGEHGFVLDPVSKQLSNLLNGVKAYDAAFLDFDNDGHEDLLVAGVGKDTSSRGVWLFHNDTTKGFSDVSYLLPANVKQGQRIAIADFNLDGDEDIFLSAPDGIHLLRNDGGNTNNFLQVQLVGLAYGNSKNNRLGIGAQVELKAGDLYQLKTVTRPLIQFGVGSRDSLDAVRIIWPNGVPQVITDPSRNERSLEKEMLKGSCPFLFTWNGKKYEFIKDMMWRSAMGMPMAINGRDTSYAFGDASKEYLLIPGEKLQPKDGKYSLKVTEELWEAVYFDKAQLVAVDHPDSVNTYVDERFVAPPFPGRKLYVVGNKHLPVAATDGNGTDVLPKLSAYDFQYVSNFSLGQYQGVAEDHDLVLDLGDKARTDSLFLFLRGWIFPSDASVNTALTQNSKFRVHPPCLQVMNKKGEWQTVIDNIGFPMGRDKMVIANLSGKFLTANDRRIRIRTNMQIYWDEAFFSTGNAKAPVQMRDLTMLDATLGYRGYSSSYRKGGPYGPEWFDYYEASTGQKWRDLTGNYTRYGDVKPLLQKADDEYIIADGGDVVTMNFDATQLPPLPGGWKRDFLIYSEGWVKDGDLNTAYGQTVAPLPFHAMPSYPYHSPFAYPSDKEHQQYQQEYNTRKVNTVEFRNALKPSANKPQAGK